MHEPDDRAERAILSSAEAYRLVAEAREQRERAERAEHERDDARRWAVLLEQRLAEETRAAYSLLLRSTSGKPLFSGAPEP